jgi:MtN3 and saliva related transmembrane protein
MDQIIGFASSFILLLTIGKQVYKQYKEGTSEGVSKWLFLGQITASIGFLIYSVMKNDIVFIVTNGLMVVNSLVGIGILFYHRRREGKESGQKPQEATN